MGNAAGKHVYVEKPLALSVDELAAIDAVKQRHATCQLMVGFNRRFAPLTDALVAHFAQVKSAKVVQIRVNAGSIPADHWIHDVKEGGGRLIGEGCHFIDLA